MEDPKPEFPPLPVIAARQPAVIELEAKKTYFFCTCGLSEKQPFCDGKHKGSGYKSSGFTSLISGKVSLCQCKHTRKSPFCDGSHSKV